MIESNQPLPHAITTEELRYRRECEKMLQSRKQHMRQRQRYSSYGNSPFVAPAWIVNGCHFYPLIDHQQYAQLQLQHEEQQQMQQQQQQQQQQRQRHQSHGRSIQQQQHHQGLKKQAKKQVTKKSMGSPGPKHSKRVNGNGNGNGTNRTESDINDTNKPLRPRGRRGRGSRVRQNAKRRAKANNKRGSGNIASRSSPPGRHNVTLAHWLDAAESRRKRRASNVDDDKSQLVESQQPSQLFLPVVSEGRSIGSILVWVPPTDDADEGGYDEDERRSFIDEILQLGERDDVDTTTLSYPFHPAAIDDRMSQYVESSEVSRMLAMLCEGTSTVGHAAKSDATWEPARSDDDIVKVVDNRDDDDDGDDARLEASLRMDERDCAETIMGCSDFDRLSLWG